MACSPCENLFNSYDSIVVSIVKSGTNALLYVQNQGRNIAQMTRIVLCYGGGAVYLRPPGIPISWTYPSATLEPGITALFYTLSGLPAGTVVQAQAEYVEVQDRSRSCPVTM